MDERRHTAFTGQRATVDQWVGGRLTAADGYIVATNILLDTGRRIVMTWRTADFPLDAPDSQVEVRFEPVAGGTKVQVHHTGIPEGQRDLYKKTWRTVYLDPMRRFFASKAAQKRALKDAKKRGVLPAPGRSRIGRRPILGPRPGHAPIGGDAAEAPSEVGLEAAVATVEPPAAPNTTEAKPAKAPKKAAKTKSAAKKAKPAKTRPEADVKICAWEECDNPSRSNSKYCSRECSNKNARARHRERKARADSEAA